MRQFSDQHLAALSVMVLGSGACVWSARRHPGRWLVPFSRALGLVILAGWAGDYVANVVLGTWTVRYGLPLQLTDAVSGAAVLALWTHASLLVEPAYFWALTASLQALLTPDLGRSFPSVFYFTYFTYHIGAVVAGCFLVFGCRLYPRPGAVGRVYLVTLAVTMVAGVGDVITGGNYMYLREKPVHSSLLNVMGRWPWYVVETAVLAYLMLVVVGVLTRAVRARLGDVVRLGPRR